MAAGILPILFHRQPTVWSLHLWSFINLPHTVGRKIWEQSSGPKSALHYVLGHYVLGRRLLYPTLMLNKNTHRITERVQWGGLQKKHKGIWLSLQCTQALSTWAPIGCLWRISNYVPGQDFLWRARLWCKHQSLLCSTEISSVIYLGGSDGVGWGTEFPCCPVFCPWTNLRKHFILESFRFVTLLQTIIDSNM